LVPELAARGILGASFADPVIGYQIVYHVEIAFLFVSLIVLGPMVRAQLEDHHPKELEYQLSTSNA
jgi:MFS transporter, BCD family, chlorophyll transporter